MHSCRVYKSSRKYIRGVTDKLQYQINNLEARIAYSIIEGINAIKTGCTELDHAKRTIISLKRNIKGRVYEPDHMVDDAHIKLNDSLQKTMFATCPRKRPIHWRTMSLRKTQRKSHRSTANWSNSRET